MLDYNSNNQRIHITDTYHFLHAENIWYIRNVYCTVMIRFRVRVRVLIYCELIY